MALRPCLLARCASSNTDEMLSLMTSEPTAGERVAMTFTSHHRARGSRRLTGSSDKNGLWLTNRAPRGASACAAWGAEVDARFLWPLGRWHSALAPSGTGTADS